MKCDLSGCKVYCTQTTDKGFYIEYGEGTEITVTTPEGKTFKYKCVNGQWVPQARTAAGAGVFGNITPTNIGPVQVETVEVDPGFDDGRLVSRRP